MPDPIKKIKEKIKQSPNKAALVGFLIFQKLVKVSLLIYFFY